MGSKLDVKIRLMCEDEIAMGPGKAALLEAIALTGSISAAARSMEMSYRRAWLLVDVMNRTFRTPLVHSSAGGRAGGGAGVTDEGRKVLAKFRELEQAVQAATREHLKGLARHLR